MQCESLCQNCPFISVFFCCLSVFDYVLWCYSPLHPAFGLAHAHGWILVDNYFLMFYVVFALSLSLSRVFIIPFLALMMLCSGDSFGMK